MSAVSGRVTRVVFLQDFAVALRDPAVLPAKPGKSERRFKIVTQKNHLTRAGICINLFAPNARRSSEFVLNKRAPYLVKKQFTRSRIIVSSSLSYARLLFSFVMLSIT